MLVDGEQWVDLGGVRQWVRIEGAQRGTVPLVVVHGGPGGHHWVFERTAGRLLARERTVVYHEQRGCGRSEAPADPGAYSIPLLTQDLAELVSWLGVPQVDLLGYSFGGGLALEMASAHPQQVRRMIAQAPVLDLHDPEVIHHQLAGFLACAQGEVAARLSALSRPSPAEQLEAFWAAVDTPTVDRFLFQNPECARQNRQWWAESGLVNTGQMARALAREQAPSHSAVGRVEAPVLLLIGRHDRNVPLAHLERLAEGLTDARLVLFEHSAHFPDLEETERYTRAVVDFLA
ncbi:alpha/beta fold hydrolase [Deinococcus hohokamensis]|uniref:Alpha/beta fold hydrolase n=1 Tax=Deinococcus hohokamensis TaxID=309883 RepID=A0ABV9I882_9DEIO